MGLVSNLFCCKKVLISIHSTTVLYDYAWPSNGCKVTVAKCDQPFAVVIFQIKQQLLYSSDKFVTGWQAVVFGI